MKKFLAIILVVAMVLVPVSALAVSVSDTTWKDYDFEAKVVTYDTAFVEQSNYGSVAKTVSGNTVKFTANIKDAIFVGWFYEDGAAIVSGDDVGIKVSGRTVTFDMTKFPHEADRTIYAKIDKAVGSIEVEYDELNPAGKVTVTWTAKDAATVKAVPNAGAKFYGWTAASINGESILGTIDKDADTLYFKDIEDGDHIYLKASFIGTSGNISSDNATAGKTDGTSSDNPKTGDNSNVALWTLMGIVALGGVAFASKKVFAK